MTRIGSLCSGYEGLGMGLAEALGIDLSDSLAWHAEYEAAPSMVLAHHWPHVPNLHDITTIDWDAIEPVDWVTAGYPCQPFSMAGKRLGENDGRHLWPHLIEGIRRVRPGHVLLENVAGHLSMGFGRVLADLAECGYVGSWVRLPASGVGAPHRRERVFIVAADADDERYEGLGARGCGTEFAAIEGDRPTPPDAEGKRRGEGRPEPAGQLRGSDSAERGNGPAADAERGGRDGRAPQPLGCKVGRAAAAGDREDAPADPHSDALRLEPVAEPWRSGEIGPGLPGVDWGVYGPAIERWQRILGRPAPDPTQLGTRGGRQLAPKFVEWMQGLPMGHVTAVPGLSRNEQLKILGNGVVPAQCAEAVRWLLATPAQATV